MEAILTLRSCVLAMISIVSTKTVLNQIPSYGLSDTADRLIFPAVIHADDMHLYYNMLSFTWKGIHLESKMGSLSFFILLVYSLIVSHCLLVIVSFALHSSGFEPHISGYNSCAVGFSAVIFSLKFVHNQSLSTSSSSSSSSMTRVHGINVPLGYACWVELVIISLVTPNASFLGHLSGILAGMLYLNGRKYLRAVYRLLSGAVVPSWQDRYSYANGNSFNAPAAATDNNSNNNNKAEEYEYYYDDDIDDDDDDRYDYIPIADIDRSIPDMAETEQPQLSREELRKQRVHRYAQKYENRHKLKRK